MRSTMAPARVTRNAAQYKYDGASSAERLVQVHGSSVLRDLNARRSADAVWLPERRFWSKAVIAPNGCWMWIAGANGRGYGSFTLKDRQVPAHRLAWMYLNGPMPKGMYACHRCDTPPCVNPDHLFAGTHADNMMDMRMKGRAASGATVGAGRTKLVPDQVREIRLRLGRGDQPVAVARDFGVTRQCIYVIAKGITWPQVTV